MITSLKGRKKGDILMISQIEELKKQLNEAKAAGGDWNTPYQELMKAVYNNSVLFFALSKNEFDPETLKSVPLISTKDFGGIPALYVFTDVNTASGWMSHYRHITDDMKFGLIGAIEKAHSSNFCSVFSIARHLGAKMIMLDEGGAYAGLDIDAFLTANNIDPRNIECIISKEEADRLISSKSEPVIKFPEFNVIPLTR